MRLFRTVVPCEFHDAWGKKVKKIMQNLCSWITLRSPFWCEIGWTIRHTLILTVCFSTIATLPHSNVSTASITIIIIIIIVINHENRRIWIKFAARNLHLRNVCSFLKKLLIYLFWEIICTILTKSLTHNHHRNNNDNVSDHAGGDGWGRQAASCRRAQQGERLLGALGLGEL